MRASMNIAIFGKTIQEENLSILRQVISKLEGHRCRLFFYAPFFQQIEDKISFEQAPVLFSDHAGIADRVDFLFSIGGDGTLLDTITLVRHSGIPVLGINLGRMGFLSSVSKGAVLPAIDALMAGCYSLDKRSLLHLESSADLFGEMNYALNELTIYKKDPFSMLTIEVSVNGHFLNSYWADGLLIATPTGSTAYSMSCGGPIIAPQSAAFVITPVATHNLTVRPIVIPDNSKISIRVVGRSREFFVGLDSRSRSATADIGLTVSREQFQLNLLQLEHENFFQTIREKLKWGLDIRN